MSPATTKEIPRGLIAMWSGKAANVPTGWAICDGNNGTPNLLAKFIRGIASAATDPGTTGGSTTVGAHTLSVGEMPAHAHPYKNYHSGDSGATIGFQEAANRMHTDGANILNTGGGGSHTHLGNEPPYYDLAYIMKL